jgi:hypothetical protein
MRAERLDGYRVDVDLTKGRSLAANDLVHLRFASRASVLRCMGRAFASRHIASRFAGRRCT